MFLFKHDDRYTTRKKERRLISVRSSGNTRITKFPNQWIGRGGAQNWPPWSPDLNPLDYHVWGYMKTVVYAQQLNTREELLQRILRAARSIKNAAVLRKFTSSLVTRDRKCIQADGGHFEQLL